MDLVVRTQITTTHFKKILSTQSIQRQIDTALNYNVAAAQRTTTIKLSFRVKGINHVRFCGKPNVIIVWVRGYLFYILFICVFDHGVI